MRFLAQFNHEKKTMTAAMRPASSPHYWKQIIAPQIKSALEVGYCFKWVKQLNINPKIRNGLLFGDQLSDLLEDKEIESDPPNDKTQSSRQSFRPIFDTDKSNHSQFTENNRKVKARAKSDLELKKTVQKINQDQSNSSKDKKTKLKLVHKQQKTASVTCLQQWLDSAGKLNKTSPKLDSNRSLPIKKISESLVRAIKPKQKNLTMPTLIKNKTHLENWQQQIDQQIKQSINKQKSKDIATKNKKPSFTRELQYDKKSAWKQHLSCNNDHTKRVPTNLLNQIQNKTSDLFQFKSPDLVPKTSLVNKELEAIINNKKLQTNLAEQQTNKTPKIHHPKAQNKLKKERTHSHENIVQDKLYSDSKQVAINQLNAKKENSKADQPKNDSPEFPPIRNHIIDDLQPSGKRTALKSESNFEPKTSLNIDEYELAETLKRIIDEQARRQGINV